MRPSRASRVSRGLLAAGVATFVALLSHVAAGGAMPGLLGIILPLVLAAAASTLLVGRRLSVWRLSLAVMLSQALFHVLFVLGAAPVAGAGADAALHASGHDHGGMTSTLSAAEPAVTGAMLHGDAIMWVLHALAAVVTIAALHRGERACAILRQTAVDAARWARRLVLVALVFVPVAPTPPDRGHPGGVRRDRRGDRRGAGSTLPCGCDGYVARRDSIPSMRTSGSRRRSPTMTFAEAGVA
ncbi:MAG: hypothetical protein ABS61_08570 [Microbacterium sp. SCN 70-18]|nr:hypothetical protein [Microbacterium chocolatum]ODT10423.1 MAG: hypothetical protein ABS61_08570 [Microbacterium sp. SCN 70-18]